jgi:heptosyltransferase-2
MGAVFPARLVVDLPNWVGDQVMALTAVHRLVNANRDGGTTLHVRPPVRRMFELLFPAASTLASRVKESPFLVARRLCRSGGRFDVGVTLRHAYRAKILIRLAARRSLGSGGEGARMLLSEWYPVDRGRHQVFDADPIMNALELDGTDQPWRPPVPPVLIEEAIGVLRAAGAPVDGGVGFAPAAAWGESKRWPAANYGQLVRRLRRLDLQPVVVIGPGEEELAHAVRSASGGDLPVVGAALDVAGLAGVLERLDALVCNDSGPMHLAAMVGTPVVALFGPTEPQRTGPLGDGHVVLSRRLDCAPCGERVCPLGHTECLHGLGVDEVERAVLELVR